MNNTAKEKKQAFIGLLVCLIANTSAAGADWVTSALTNIAETFPNVPYSMITLVNNIPNLCAVLFTIVAGALVNRKISLKNMMLIGIGFHAIGGVMPALTGNSSFAVLLLGRFAFGIGYGIMQGLCISMSFKLVTNEALRESAMGWALTAQYATNMVAQVVVGYLCEVRWNYSFYIYAWSIIPFLVVLLLCPRFPLDKDDRSAMGGEGSSLGKSETLWQSIKAMPATVWCFTVIVGLYMVCYYPMFLCIAQIIIGRGFGSPVNVGYAMTFYSVSSLLGGLLFGLVAKQMRHWMLFFSLVGVAISALGIYLSTSYAMVCIFLVVGGFTSTCILPACNNAYYKQVPPHRSFLASSVTLAGLNIGAFLGTPYIALVETFGGEAETCLLISPVILVIMGLVSVRLSKNASEKDSRLSEIA
ncbi:MAG: MFS transporter [Faecousia sp.]